MQKNTKTKLIMKTILLLTLLSVALNGTAQTQKDTNIIDLESQYTTEVDALKPTSITQEALPSDDPIYTVHEPQSRHPKSKERNGRLAANLLVTGLVIAEILVR